MQNKIVSIPNGYNSVQKNCKKPPIMAIFHKKRAMPGTCQAWLGRAAPCPWHGRRARAENPGRAVQDMCPARGAAWSICHPYMARPVHFPPLRRIKSRSIYKCLCECLYLSIFYKLHMFDSMCMVHVFVSVCVCVLYTTTYVSFFLYDSEK